jgi:undecaprenyl-diphosphatase
MEQIDRFIVVFLNQFVGRSDVFDRLLDALVSVNLFTGIILVACVWYVWFKKDAKRDLILRRFVGVALSGPVSRAVQLLFRYHPRPFHSVSFHSKVPANVEPAQFNHWSSFPSDHAAVFGALATLITFHSRRLGIAAWIWTGVIVLPRIYLGYHWPSDVVAGLAIGFSCVYLGRFLPERAAAFVLKLETRNRPGFYAVAFLISYEVGILFEDLRRAGTALSALGHLIRGPG